MPVSPLQARCRHCLGDFFLFEIVDRRSTTCPRCGRTLTDTDEFFLEAAEWADVAQRLLIEQLRHVQSAHGVLSVLPNTLLRNVFEQLDWERPFRADAALADQEIALLDKYRARWRAHRADRATTIPNPTTHIPLSYSNGHERKDDARIEQFHVNSSRPQGRATGTARARPRGTARTGRGGFR